MAGRNEAPEVVELVFSDRSPFAWIAAHHVLPMVHRRIRLRFTPFFPLPEFANSEGGLVPAKARRNVREIIRLDPALSCLPSSRPNPHAGSS